MVYTKAINASTKNKPIEAGAGGQAGAAAGVENEVGMILLHVPP